MLLPYYFQIVLALVLITL